VTKTAEPAALPGQRAVHHAPTAAIDAPARGSEAAAESAAHPAAQHAAGSAAENLCMRRRGESKHGGDGGTREKMMSVHGRSPLEAAAHPRPSKEIRPPGLISSREAGDFCLT
jgi:hypothetical protein